MSSGGRSDRSKRHQAHATAPSTSAAFTPATQLQRLIASTSHSIGDSGVLRSQHIDTLQVLEQYEARIAQLESENAALKRGMPADSQLSNDRVASEIAAATGRCDSLQRDVSQLQSRLDSLRQQADNTEQQNKHMNQALVDLKLSYSALQQVHANCSHDLNAAQQKLTHFEAQLADAESKLRGSAAHVHSVESRASSVESDLRQQLSDAQQQRMLAQQQLAALTNNEQPATQKHHTSNLAPASAAALSNLSAASQRVSELESLTSTLTARVQHLESTLADQHQQLNQQQNVIQQLNQIKQEIESQHQQETEHLKQHCDFLQSELTKANSELSESKALNSSFFSELTSLRHSMSTHVCSSPPPDLDPSVSTLRQQLSHTQQLLSQLRVDNSRLQQQAALAHKHHAQHANMAANTITIASKRGMFPEFVQVKKENEALKLELAHLQTILQHHVHQGTAMSFASAESKQSASSLPRSSSTRHLSSSTSSSSSPTGVVGGLSSLSSCTSGPSPSSLSPLGSTAIAPPNSFLLTQLSPQTSKQAVIAAQKQKINNRRATANSLTLNRGSVNIPSAPAARRMQYDSF